MFRVVSTAGRLIARAAAATAVAVLLSTAVSESQAAGSVGPASGVATPITADEWALWRERFLQPNGRVVDIEKNGVSHSEGQGYGLLLAVKAGDRRAFDTIHHFTWTHMRRRGDRLVSWLWDPRAYPPVPDTNNATDGDVLIAYALLLAAARWDEPRYVAHALPVIDAIGRTLLTRDDGLVVVRPAAFGFDPGVHEDGPVVNLSYYVYGAFLLFEAVDDRYPWREAWQSGLVLTDAARHGRLGLVPDWVTLRRERYLSPAAGFAPASSYDAVRIPLYMALGGRVPARYIAPFDAAWSAGGNPVPLHQDLSTDTTVMPMNDGGYRAIAALAACAVRGVPIPAEVQRYRTTTYFSSTLHLLALAAIRQNYAECLVPREVLAAADIPIN